MLELLFGAYGLIWWLVFRRFKLLPINLWTVVTSILIIVVVLLFGLLMLSRYQPMTSHARTYAVTTPIVAEVRGKVIEVPAEGGAMVAAGDVLLRIDPVSYEAQLASVEAQLALAKANLTQQERAAEGGASSAIELERARSEAARLEADAQRARYELERTTITAPAAGFVEQVAVRPGQFVSPMAFNQVMVFVHADADADAGDGERGPAMVAFFAQGAATFIDAGDAAEVAFHAYPGAVFSATVRRVQPLLAEGAVSASGRLQADVGRRAGRVPVHLTLDADPRLASLPAGSSGKVTVYTGKRHHLNLVRKIILRIKSWEHWVFAP